MILDDPLCFVDPITSTAIMQNLFGPNGLTNQWGCTVLMASNACELENGTSLGNINRLL